MYGRLHLADAHQNSPASLFVKVWETMPIDLMTGRSDFQLMELPTSTVIQPKSGG